eukprot:scaffold3648_cov149-Amphora_coffeaeformis.AAC.9
MYVLSGAIPVFRFRSLQRSPSGGRRGSRGTLRRNSRHLKIRGRDRYWYGMVPVLVRDSGPPISFSTHTFAAFPELRSGLIDVQVRLM